MEQIIDSDPFSNSYFFITGFSDIFGAGKNSFIVNCTNNIVVGEPIYVYAYDVNGNSLPVSEIYSGGTDNIKISDFGKVYVVTVPESTPHDIGRLEINGVGVDTGLYTGSIAYFDGEAYAINKNTRLPLIQAPNSTPFPQVGVKWTRNILIDTSKSTTTQVRFFDLPYINVTPELYYYTMYATGSYRMASGSCSAIAVTPKNNDNGNFDYSSVKPIYQLHAKNGSVFSGSMEGERIRIKNPYVKNFTYANYTNNQIAFEGVLNTDFIATIDRVVNSGSLLLNIPFATVSDLISRINEDSVYNKNNLTNIFGYDVNNDPMKQIIYKKNNFYILSISDADYEIFYNDIPPDTSPTTGSAVKSLINVEFNNLRAYCGNVETYKIFGRSMNSPEYKTLLCEGKVFGEELITTKNFKNGLYSSAGKFFSPGFTNRFWLTGSSAVTFSQDHGGYINGARIGNPSAAGLADYVIFKDDTTGAARTAAYVEYTLINKSYWYASSDAFLNSSVIPSASYAEVLNVPVLTGYTTSVENILSGPIYDSNPIRLRRATLYEFSMYVRPFANNTADSIIEVYYISKRYIIGGGSSRVEETLIGTIDSTFKFSSDEIYSNTFFSDVDGFGTIKLVPSAGNWYITNVSLKPYKAVDYSVDSFAAKVPLRSFTANELYEIEAELYDGGGKLAYGDGSYTFETNKIFTPLRKRIFIDPNGLAVV
jgi:hypothetical protein